MIEKKRGLFKDLCDIINPYCWITAIRNRLFDYGLIKSHEFEIPTICIGNISVGGTGKTPHTEYLIRLLKEKFNTVVLSRGYGRKSKGYILANNGFFTHGGHTANMGKALFIILPFQHIGAIN